MVCGAVCEKSREFARANAPPGSLGEDDQDPLRVS